jgi:filamentous hemagglutinin family protein
MRCILLSTCIATLAVLPASVCWAQVTADSTLNTTVNGSGNDFTITNGTARGSNLFHSFQQFGIPTGGSATFDLVNTPNISTIFSRVTGGSVSTIDGTIQTVNSSNPVSLFLINPAGILFGPNASLNMGGSFVGTTASSIQFADGAEFSAVNPTGAPLLTISVPVGLQMGSNPGTIQVTNTGHQLALVGGGLLPLNRSKTPPGLQVPVGKTLALIGGAVDLTGGIVQAPGGHIELGSIRAGAVNLAPTNQGWAFGYGPNSQFQDIRLSQKAIIDASGDGGSMQLRGQNILFSDSSWALIQHTGSQRGGDLILNAADTIAFSQSQPSLYSSRLETQTLGTGSTGEIQITAQRLSLQNETNINTSSYAPGGSGAIRINVAESIEQFGAIPGDLSGGNTRIVASGFRGNSGDILITTKQLSLRNGASIGSNAFGKDNGGNVIINATDFIEVLGAKPNVFNSSVSSATYGSGNGGNLTVNTPRLGLRDGGTIRSSTYGTGNAGSLVVNASERLEVSGIATDTRQIPSSITAGAIIAAPVLQRILGIPAVPTGNAGNVTITTPQLSINNGAEVQVNNIGSGNAGNLTIVADRLSLNTTGKLAASTASGEGGNIVLNLGGSLLMRQGSRIDAQAAGNGNGGNITINAPIIAGFENSDIIANAVQGRGGNIQINTQGIFGLKFRPQLTPDNDITASSQFGVNGIVQVNTLGVDPSAGLVNLPVNLVDPSRQIATGCGPNQDSSFVATGRGGIPQNPTQEARNDRPWADTRDLSEFRTPRPAVPTALSPVSSTIVEASTLKQTNGQLELVATNSLVPTIKAASCARAIEPPPRGNFPTQS